MNAARTPKLHKCQKSSPKREARKGGVVGKRRTGFCVWQADIIQIGNALPPRPIHINAYRILNCFGVYQSIFSFQTIKIYIIQWMLSIDIIVCVPVHTSQAFTFTIHQSKKTEKRINVYSETVFASKFSGS